MLFNSYEFLFLFLPITAAVFFFLGRFSRALAIRWLIVASLFFYAWWRPLNVLLIAPSIFINYGLARTLQRLIAAERPGAARWILVLGIAFNVAFLGYFKYANFLVGAVNDVFGTRYFLERIVLPLGISFITFQKIAFLVDVAAKRVVSFTLQDYCLFVLFFPQLIAGPIVHYREMMPQFQNASCVYDRRHVAVGITLFFAGLFKKVVLADGISPLVGVIYAQAAHGQPITLLYAWMAAIGFTLQIYFDFSGYSDMAIGIARIFGVRLPANFNSPLRATNIIDFWLRWHMTLTRFLTAYLYNPFSLWLTRRRLARGLKGFGGKNTTPGAFVSLLMLPTLMTMCISGLWHGAGYTYIFWGFLHGVYLSINHLWHVLVRPLWTDKERYRRIMSPIGFVVTFASVAAAMVFFKAPSMAAARSLIAGMAGMHGVAVPAKILGHFGAAAQWLPRWGLGIAPVDESFSALVYWIVGLSALALLAPNTMQILASEVPALGIDSRDPYRTGPRLHLTWRPSLAWAAAAMAVTAAAVVHMGGVSEFLYWQF